MPISNNTDERVGVEVSGPGSGPDHPLSEAVIVLEPQEKLADPDSFNNLIVKFYRVEGQDEDVVGEQIATIDFDDDDYTVTYFQGGTDLRKMTEPEKMGSGPILVGLDEPNPADYQVDIQAAA